MIRIQKKRRRKRAEQAQQVLQRKNSTKRIPSVRYQEGIFVDINGYEKAV